MLLATDASAQTQDLNIALQRGYRTGYSDGYMAGYRDTIDSVTKNFSRHAEYTKADRAYNKDYGTIDEYRDGYQQGFEAGYNTGFEKRSFESTLPTDLKRRGAATTGTAITGNIAENTQLKRPINQRLTPS
jgi:flagellar biosynthesis/type III secretory pathway protein FliH